MDRVQRQTRASWHERLGLRTPPTCGAVSSIVGCVEKNPRDGDTRVHVHGGPGYMAVGALLPCPQGPGEKQQLSCEPRQRDLFWYNSRLAMRC